MKKTQRIRKTMKLPQTTKSRRIRKTVKKTQIIKTHKRRMKIPNHLRITKNLRPRMRMIIKFQTIKNLSKKIKSQRSMKTLYLRSCLGAGVSDGESLAETKSHRYSMAVKYANYSATSRKSPATSF